MFNSGNFFLKGSLLICSIVLSLSAQPFLLSKLPDGKTSASISFKHPSLERRDDLTIFSGIYNMDLIIPVSEKLNITVNIPYAAYSYEEYEGESGLGNISFSLLVSNRGENLSNMVYGGGFYLPTVEDKITSIGVITDYYWLSRYLNDALIAYGQFGYQKYFENNLMLGLEIIPNFAVATGDRVDSEFYIQYGFMAGVKSSQFSFAVELGGSAIFTEDVDEESDRYVHQLEIGASYGFGKVTPGFAYMLYLDEDFEKVIDGVLCIQIQFALDKE